MPHYRVVWEIDSWADTPAGAEAEARRAMTDPDTLATVFTVRETDEGGNVLSETALDLGENGNAPAPPGETRDGDKSC